MKFKRISEEASDRIMSPVNTPKINKARTTEAVKVVKQEVKKDKAEQKARKKFIESKIKQLERVAKKKAVSKRVFKRSKTTVVIGKPIEQDNSPSHFFTSEMGATKRSMYFQ